MENTDEFQSSAVISMIPEILLDTAKTLQVSRQKTLSKDRSLVEKIEQEIIRYHTRDQQLTELKTKKEEEARRLTKEIDEIKKEYYKKEGEENVVRNELTSIKSLLAKTIEHAPNEEQLSELIQKLTEVKIEMERKKVGLKQEVEQFKKGIQFYKKYMLCNVIYVPKETVILTLNLTAKSPSDVTDYIKFTTTNNGRTFHYVEMSPSVEQEQSLLKRYQETKDIQTFILSFWKILRNRENKRILQEKN